MKLLTHRGRTPRDVLAAWLVATVLSGAPSTIYALATGGDPLEATRAAGRMLLPDATDTLLLVAAAGIVHGAVSLLWTIVFCAALPSRKEPAWGLVASAAVGILDLKLIAPVFFPSVAALEFGPQLADHLAWGACVGGTLAYRRMRSGSRFASNVTHL